MRMRPIAKIHGNGIGQRLNTIAYIEQSVSLGAQMVELDVQVTGDGVAVVYHDDSVNGRPVAETDYEILQKINPELIPLEEALRPFLRYDVAVNLDLKSPAFCQTAYETVDALGLLSRTVVSGIQFSDFNNAKSWFDPERLWVSTEFREEGIPAEEWNSYIIRNLKSASEIGCRNLNCYIRNVSRDFILQAHHRGFLVHVWTANRRCDMENLIAWGADSIATDRLPVLMHLLECHPCSPPPPPKKRRHPMTRRQMHYQSPAEKWFEALPLGNGRIGAMVFGGIREERYALNEDTLWSGTPTDLNRKDAWIDYHRARALALQGRYKESHEIVRNRLCGEFGEAYMPLGNLRLNMLNAQGSVSSYRRVLDLDNAVHTVSYRQNGAGYVRESFLSAVRQALYIRLRSEGAAMNLQIRCDSPLRGRSEASSGEVRLFVECPSHTEPNYENSPDPVRYFDEPNLRGIRAMAVAKVLSTDGVCSVSGNALFVREASEIVLVFCVRSDFAGWDIPPFASTVPFEENCRNDLAHAAELSFSEAKDEHRVDYQQYFNRVALNLEGQDEYAHLPVDRRLSEFSRFKCDNGLYVLMFDYARYLMISASRPGSQPMNLQGIWNEELIPPWSSNYTTNINTEMNYWPALPCRLAELQEPLDRFMRELCVAGQETARRYYNARGFAVHHNVDLWRHCNPMGRHKKGCDAYGFWPMAAGWLCRHLYEKYEYTQNLDFLRDYAYPIIREAALFFLDVLVPDENGLLVFAPSTSPENHFLFEGEQVAVAKSSAMSASIIRELFINCANCCEILQTDIEFAKLLNEKLKRLPPLCIGQDGGLLEWNEELEECMPDHRHLSHLYALYPGDEISPDRTPALARAAEVSLIKRTDKGAGWSLAWKLNLWARLRKGDRALSILKQHLRLTTVTDINLRHTGGGVYPNLFNAHPPFQIDGNFGICAGILELLLQNDGGKLLLLPALPTEWRQGAVSGIGAKGGLIVDLKWENGHIVYARLLSSQDKCVTVCADGRERNVHLKANAPGTLYFNAKETS